MKKLDSLFNTVLVAAILTSCHTSKSLVVISTTDAPKVIAPYSQAIEVGNMVYTSGQIGLSPVTNTLVGTDIGSQTQRVLKNLKAVLEAAGSDMEHVIKVTVYLKDMDDYAKVNDIYKDYFPGIKPARSAVQVARLPKDALVEIECVGEIK